MIRSRFFLAGFIFCLTVWCALSAYVFQARNGVLPELDDSYGYLAKASEMKECFFQDSPALNDLGQQLFLPPDHDKINLVRSRILHRLFSVYHPLHSAIVTVLKISGMTWEGSFWLIFFVGKIFFVCAVAFWLYHVTGPVNAGGALLLLALSSFAGQGLLFVVPSNLALGLAFFLWGLLSIHPFSYKKTSLVLVFLMETMHPIGRLYAAAGLLALFFSSDREEFIGHWRYIVLYALLIVVPFLLPFVIHTPFLGIIKELPPSGWSFSLGFHNELNRAAQILNHWLDDGFPGIRGRSILIYFATVMSGFWGFAALPRSRKKKTLAILVALLFLLSLQFVRMDPHYPGVLFARILVPLAILYYALLVSGIRKAVEVSFGRGLDSGGFGMKRLVSVLLLPLLLFFVVYHESGQVRRVYNAVTTMISRHPLKPDVGQIDRLQLLIEAKSQSEVLYYDELSLYFYLTHDMWRQGAVAGSAVFGTAIEKKWINRDGRMPEYIVARSPLSALKKIGYLKGIRLRPGEYVDVVSLNGHFDFTTCLLDVQDNTGGISINSIDVDGKLESGNIGLTDRGGIVLRHGWERALQGIRIANSGNFEKMINGFRPENMNSAGLHWPWDTGLVFKSCYRKPAGKRYSTRFSTHFLSRRGFDPYVINDSGATVLFEHMANSL